MRNWRIRRPFRGYASCADVTGAEARRLAAGNAWGTRRLAACAAILVLIVAGCSSIERAKPRPESARVDRSFEIEVPQIMRGTIASEAILDGYQPVVARGYGLVVGLSGTGSRDIPPQLRAHMIAELAKQGFGSPRHGMEDLKPETMLNSEDTAVVIVEAVIPPGAIGARSYRNARLAGTRFDVRLYADPNTGTRSLEGGELLFTELRPGPARVGSGQAAAIARARGPIFVNPFAEPGSEGNRNASQTTGVILNGGECVRDMPLKLRLASPSHVRAANLQTTINARFPREPGQRDQTARGESDEAIRITVPPSFRDSSDEFVKLLQHTTIRLSEPESVANSVRRVLLADPVVAGEASWRWQALGQRAIPVIRTLYDYPEEVPRFAALRAGAKLDDALVIEHLLELGKEAATDIRVEAIKLLADMRTNPLVDSALRGLLNDDDVDVRLAAYETLADRDDPYMRRYAIDAKRGSPPKFILDVVQSEKPMIYITQFGQPRIVLFGDDLSIDTPVFVRAWQNRFMMKELEDDPEGQIEVFYRRNPEDLAGVIHRVDPNLEQFVQFLGHTTTVERPSPGLGMSYGETVGALHQIWSQRFIEADFKAEQDRILAAIMRQERESTVIERPEFGDSDEDWPEYDAAEPVSELERLSPMLEPGMPGRTGTEISVPRSGSRAQ